MNTDLTDITLVVDRSGSMGLIKDDAEGGVNAFIDEQAKPNGKALLTLVQFDTEYEFLCKGMPIQEVAKYKLTPRGMTALHDAVGRAVNETEERLSKLPEEHRPGLVIFVVMTDGQENSSVEFTKTQVKQMIECKQDENNWHFTFLGANQDAFAEAGGIGIQFGGVANYSVERVEAAWRGTSAKCVRMRQQSRSGDTVENEFTTEEREAMSDAAKSRDQT